MRENICPKCDSAAIEEGYFNNGYASSVRLVGKNPLKPHKVSVYYCDDCGYILGLWAKK